MKAVNSHSRIALLIALVLLMVPAGSRVSGQDQAKGEESSLVKGLQLSVELVGTELLKPDDGKLEAKPIRFKVLVP